MPCPFAPPAGLASRRGVLAAAGGLLAAASAGPPARAATSAAASVEPFHGPHQGGIATPQQTHTYFAAFDLLATTRDAVSGLLRGWTEAAARLTAGLDSRAATGVAGDGGAAAGLSPARLTLTFGFGPGMFIKDGQDRYGLAAQRPAALADLPKFNGDQLEPGRSGGDLSVQACADDPQVAFHAVRELSRLAYGAAQLRWVQTGFLPNTPPGETPRNLMGFKDGSNNPRPRNPADFDPVVWVGEEGPAWMRGGSYAVVRRIRVSLEHWDRSEVAFQEEVIGRHKTTGAPLGGARESDRLDLARVDADGNAIIPDTAHVRLGAAETNGGARLFRRGYAYNDGVTFIAERWPPWRQGMMYDAGLLFVAYQRDPRTGFTRIFENMAKLDALNQFATHTGGGLFACPAGIRPGAFIGQDLLLPA